MVFAHAEGVLHAVERQIRVQTELVIVAHHRHAQPVKLVPVERVIVVLVLHALGRQILVQIAHVTVVLALPALERRILVLMVLVTVGLVRLAPERRILVPLVYVTVALQLLAQVLRTPVPRARVFVVQQRLPAPQIPIPVPPGLVTVTRLMLAQEHRTPVRQVHAYVVQPALPVTPVKPVRVPHQPVHVHNTSNTQVSHTPSLIPGSTDLLFEIDCFWNQLSFICSNTDSLGQSIIHITRDYVCI